MSNKKGVLVITRRDFIKMSLASAAALGLSPLIQWPKMAEAALNKPAVVWLEGQDCAGCTESVISSYDAGGNILNVVEILYHETIMNAAGDMAEGALDAAILEGGYILVVEGSMPINPEFLKVAGHPLETKFYAAAKAAGAIAAVGACACYGGIPRAGSTSPGQDTQGQGLKYFIDNYNAENPGEEITAPLVNLPGCPVHPRWFWDTAVAVIDTLVNGAPLPDLDDDLRPTSIFGKTVHDECPRKKHYNGGRFLTDWNSRREKGWCLLYKGCKGPWTYANCNDILWNEGANSCIYNNAPCAGCTEPAFYPGFSPLFRCFIPEGEELSDLPDGFAIE